MADYAFNPYALPMLFSGLGMLAIGSVVALRRRFDPLGLSFFLVCLSAACWLFGFTGAFFSTTERTAFLWDKYLSLLGTMWIPSSCYFFAVSFSQDLSRRRLGLSAAFGASAYFTWRLFSDTPWMLEGMHPYFFGWYSAYGPGMKYFILCFASLMAACNLELHGLYSRSTSGIERLQALWVFVGFTVGSFGAWDYLPGYGFEIYPVGYLFILAFIGSFAYALEYYHLMDVRTAFVQTGIWLLTALLLAGPLWLGIKVVRPALGPLPDWGLALIFVGIFVLSLLYWNAVESRLTTMFQRRRDSTRRAFEELYKSFRFSSGLRETVEATLDTLDAAFGLYHISYWRLQSAGGSVRLVSSRHLSLPDSLALPPSLAARLMEADEVQEMRDLPNDDATREFLGAVQAALLLPVKRGEEVLGFFVLGSKRSLAAFQGYQLNLLNDFRERLGVALKSAILVDQVQEMTSQVMLAEQRAREVEKVKADFLQAVSHELRTPIFAISGYAEAMLGQPGAKPAEDTQARFAQVIHRAAERIGTIVADMIRASSLERESLEVRADWFDFGAACERVMEPFRKRIGLIRFSLEIPAGVLKVHADKDKIEDVLFRLLSNAVKFSPPDGTVTVWARPAEPGFEFGVADQGPGLSPEARRRLFEKFNRPYDGADEINLKNPGSGLGLYISKTLIEMQRGTIRVDPAARGCRVTVWLPQPAVAPPAGRLSTAS